MLSILPLSSRRLGQSGLSVSPLAFGGWGIGGPTEGATSYGPVDDGLSEAAITQALALGITLFDTANVYGDGHGERVLGRAMAGAPAGGLIATKAGMVKFGQPSDFSPGAIGRSLAGSLERLQRDRVDILQLHNPPFSDPDRCRALARELEQLRRQGLIAAGGWSVKSPEDGLAAIRDYGAEMVQLNFNLLDWRAVECGLFAEAEARQVGILARTPLCFGFLSGSLTEDSQFAPTDHRSAWPRAQIAAWLRAAERLFEALEAPVGAASALRFCHSFPAVSSIVAGMMTPQEVSANVAALQLPAFPGDAIERAYQTYRDQPIFAGAAA